MASQNKELGRFQLTGIRRALRGVPQIEVTFAIDANGIVNVSARDLATGRAQDITITATSNMSREEIDRAIRDARQYAAEDSRTREQAGAKDHAERALYRASGAQGLSKEARSRLAELTKEVKRALRGSDARQTEQAAAALDAFLDASGCTDADSGGFGPTADDAMDAEYETVREEKE